MKQSSQVAALAERGVKFLAPETVFVAPDVNPERIAPGVVIHPGCRLAGAALAIGPDCVLGEEGPVTIRDCQIGAGVRLRGGAFERATMRDGVDGGSCAHVRFGTLLEEKSQFGHSVGFKQTVLLPFVTTGSLINFCDVLMAGGTGADNHSEVGSSYVHFNFTTHQEKATPSLIGDVPRGVMLDQAPIFLGGQGGLVGPCRIEYGTVLAAGLICRRDVLTPNLLVTPGAPTGATEREYDACKMGTVDRRVANNLHFIGNLLALDAWHRQVRARFVREPWQQFVHDGALARLDEMFAERIKQMAKFSEKTAISLAHADGAARASQQAFVTAWPAMKVALEKMVAARDYRFLTPSALAALEHSAVSTPDYLSWVRSADYRFLTPWLQGIVDDCTALWTR